jgi:hypothetical protein
MNKNTAQRISRLIKEVLSKPLKEDKCNFEIFYTLTGLEEFSASVGKVVKENDKYEFIVFDEEHFTDDDLDEDDEFEEDESEEE